MSLTSSIPLPVGWATWSAIITGAIVTVLAIWAGISLRRRPPVARPASSDDLVVSTLSTPPSDAEHDPFQDGSADEKRACFRRKGRHVEVYLSHSEELEPPILGYVVDRSIGGLRLGVDEQILPGTYLRVRPREAPPGAKWVEVEVKSCTHGDGCWQLGCAYVKTPSWGDQLLFG